MGRKFTNFALFYFVFKGKFRVQAPQGGLYSEGRFHGGFLALTFWGAYIWRGSYTEFYGTLTLIEWNFKVILTSCLWTVSRLVNRKHYYLNLFFNFPWITWFFREREKILEIIRDARKVNKFHAVRHTVDIFLTLDTQTVSLHLATYTFWMICFSYALVFNGSRTHPLRLKNNDVTNDTQALVRLLVWQSVD